MTTIIITEKTSQKKDLANAIGNKYGEIYPAEGHLLSLQEPQHVNGAWTKWSFDLLKPDQFYPTCPAPDASPSAKNKLAAIENALKKASKVILATDCDREGQLIGEELLRHYEFDGEVERAMFTAQDEKTLREAFQNLEPNEKYTNLGQAAVVRQQADQVYNLSLTRAATVALKEPGQYGAIGIGRVKTPTLAIVCIRELEIQKFEKSDFYHIVANVTAQAGEFQLKYAPKEKITDKELAETIRAGAEGFEGKLKAQKKVKKTKPPKLLDLPELQKICSRKWGWTANKTLDVAQELYDGNGKKIQTYPRAESRYLAENQTEDVGQIVEGLKGLAQFKDIDLGEPEIRIGKGGHFSDAALKGVSHHAIVPNKNTMDKIATIYPRLSEDEKKMFDLVASSYLAILMPDYVYESTSIAMDVPGPEDKTLEFKITGNIPKEQGWKSVYTDVMEKKEEHAGELPPVQDGDMGMLNPVTIDVKKTKPPARFNEGSLIDAMQNAWKFIEDKEQQERLKEAKGIGTPATRASIIAGLKMQNFLIQKGKHIIPSEAGLALYKNLKATAPELVDPGVTALWEMKLDDVLLGKQQARDVWDEIGDETARLINVIRNNASKAPKIVTGLKAPKGAKGFGGGKPTDKMKAVAKSIATNKGLNLPKGYTTDFQICREFLDEHLGGKPADPVKVIEKKLAAGVIHGINAKMATSIVEVFGADSQKIIEETPERLKEVKGISAAKIKVITQGLEDKKHCAEIADYLNGCGVSPFHALRLYKAYGTDCLSILEKTPYQTVRDIKSFGFDNADCLAHKIGLQQESFDRAQTAIYHALNQAGCMREKDTLLAMLEKRLGISAPVLEKALKDEIEAKGIHVDGEKIGLLKFRKAEQKITRLMKNVGEGECPWGALDAEKAISWACGKFKLMLNGEQRQALQMTLSSKLSMLDVVAGEGQGDVLKALVNILQAKGLTVNLCCPTKTAAKKLATETGLDVLSITKLLEWNSKTQKFKRTAKKNLDGQLIVVSDPHLLDQNLLQSLLEATSKEASVLFICDTYKASGFNLLSDVQTVALPLQNIQSQRLVSQRNLRENGPMVSQGDESDFFQIKVNTENDTLRMMTEIIKNRLPKRFKFDAIKDIQMVCPLNGGAMGAHRLNLHLQQQLNPPEGPIYVERFGARYRVGDKVMLSENDLDKELLAGEIGFIKSIETEAQTLSISFAGKSATFQYDELDHIQLAYAIPAAKAQFVTSKAVVMYSDDMQKQQSMIYNALSQSEDFAVLLG